MQRLGKNIDRYAGETVDIRATLRDIEAAAQSHGWQRAIFHKTDEFEWVAYHRFPAGNNSSNRAPRIYLSSGIHGDEPAGLLAMRQLLQANRWPANAELRLCPCLNPGGFALNRRENAAGVDLNRQYRKPSSPETLAHINWLEQQPGFDLCLMLHEDWESHGFYLYEQNPDHQPSLAEPMIESVAEVCPIDSSPVIEGRPAHNGIIRPGVDPRERPLWPEAFYLITRKTRLSYTLEAPSDFPLATRVAALCTAVNTAVSLITERIR